MKFLKYISIIAVVFFLQGCNSTQPTNTSNSKPFNQKEYYQSELKAVRKEKYKKGKILNKEEWEFYILLQAALQNSKREYYISPQTSLGAFLRHKEKEMFFKINCKRADFLIFNQYGYPEMIVEYNGTGHYQQEYKLRDEIKKEACESANIPIVFISYSEDKQVAIQQKILTKL